MVRDTIPQFASLLRMKLLSVFPLSYHCAVDLFLYHEVAITWRSTSLLVLPVLSTEYEGHYVERFQAYENCPRMQKIFQYSTHTT